MERDVCVAVGAREYEYGEYGESKATMLSDDEHCKMDDYCTEDIRRSMSARHVLQASQSQTDISLRSTHEEETGTDSEEPCDCPDGVEPTIRLVEKRTAGHAVFENPAIDPIFVQTRESLTLNASTSAYAYGPTSVAPKDGSDERLISSDESIVSESRPSFPSCDDLVLRQQDMIAADIFALLGDVDGDERDDILPVVAVWLDIGAQFTQEEIPSPIDFIQQYDALAR